MASIEYHPENGAWPWVIVADVRSGERKLWFACKSKEHALAKLPNIESELLRLDGLIEIDDTKNFGYCPDSLE